MRILLITILAMSLIGCATFKKPVAKTDAKRPAVMSATVNGRQLEGCK